MTIRFGVSTHQGNVEEIEYPDLRDGLGDRLGFQPQLGGGFGKIFLQSQLTGVGILPRHPR